MEIGSSPSWAQIGWAQLPKPGSNSQIKLFKEWLRVCDEQHNHHFNPRNKLPTRVLDLGSTEKPNLCLCDGFTSMSEGYVALSHCWGVDQHFKTLQSNIDAFKQHIKFDNLPATFRDAIRVTMALGFRYLWIDSLCIIQDDPDDWEREAASMEHVFSSANLTIAASSARSSSEGFWLSKRPQQPRVAIRAPSGSSLLFTRFSDDFCQDVEQSVLNERGWVLQERALARRTIHFTSTQVYWECGSGIHCESLMKLVNPKAAFLGDSDFPKSALGLFKGARILLFQALYETYSALEFTNITDRSIAIKGLEGRLVNTFSTKGGFGVFEGYLHRSLLWQRRGETALAPITYPAKRHVPTWSWMAYTGGICYMEAMFDHVDWTNDVLSPFVTESGRKQHWEAANNDIVPWLHCRVKQLKLKDSDISERIVFDDARHSGIEGLFCVVLGIDKVASPPDSAVHFVLVITRAPQAEFVQYTRVGVGKLLRKHVSEDLGMSVIV
ncbi:hypothetical protein CCHR01_06492 [Colletotrichum chrysophilum]|uniref:Heterokaryon incompatibility domain-containing protein n=1 Tax=Colletotrichum chrysophilum TaxID=1836956 RepID=A0AAD9ANW5_9PEZI|nr:hypothetical protein CCHR01_06492 [Colletotrichum chrysophilum]